MEKSNRKTIFNIARESFHSTDAVLRINALVSNECIVVRRYGKWKYDEGRDIGDNLFGFIDEFGFSKWEHRNGFISSRDMLESLNFNLNDKKSIQENDILNYLEFIYNLMCLSIKFFVWRTINNTQIDREFVERYISDEGFRNHIHSQGSPKTRLLNSFLMAFNDIETTVAKMGYEIKSNYADNMHIIVNSDAAATTVAALLESDIAYDINSYNHFSLNGNIESKSKILAAIAKEYEGIELELKKINEKLHSNIGFMLNNLNIRHNNVEGKHKQPLMDKLSEEDLELCYDETYQMLLLAFLINENAKRHNWVQTLKSINNGATNNT